MKTLYVEGNTFLHRMSSRVKLLCLAATSVVLFAVQSTPVLGLLCLASALLYLLLRLPPKDAWARLRPVLLTIIVVGLFTLVVDSATQAAVFVLRLTSLMLLAATVTATTGIAEFMDEVTRLATPLERIGLVKASDIGLAVGLVIRFVPEVLARYQAIRDAHHARGLRPRILTLAVPMIILTLRNADEIASAIDARGLRGHK
ncbi:energy-coupling factor transporter transmembrane protein EcfT [Neorhizobium lilium]|uniref:Energy-coupling factor transporter transmembrane protein EcfT n=1 Tax=Neorhizobium lilium TaxID=2503024 RepID=A0A444LGM3_9HYPH|nr:energy-coupling factor transporter transmembrane protein EcfT [Neorhizobium lilium]RWX77200.1 energy-coupling factor transporter transmembrane protein EcfT [Neorhizobium lilium]